ncbi:TetR/AcrR family transcriptional regulator [Nonomuraea angiospora]|uniref:TetR/AcrR family transcriptional regulator n=1 Tax=Nonomuraea angiospora TaxID=46172 RepID=UPI0033EB1200
MTTDPEVELLWREQDREPRPGLSLGRIVRAAIEIADAEGLDGLSMRKVADRLGFTTMSLYRHVPGRDQLVDLMVDEIYGERSSPPEDPEEVEGLESPEEPQEPREPGRPEYPEEPASGQGWRVRLEAAARQGWQLRRRHPWLAEVRGTRHLPGPNAIAHFDHMLSTLTGTGLRPSEVIAVVSMLGRFVDAEALTLVETRREERRSGVSEQEWWGSRDALYERLNSFPTLSRLWMEGGWDHPEDSFEFGLRRQLDGVAALIRERDESRDESSGCPECGTPLEPAPSGRPRVYCSRACQQRAYRKRKSG